MRLCATLKPMQYFETIICVSDLQAPFQHPDALKFLAAVKKKYYVSAKKTKIINQGDELDAHTLSVWGSDPDGYSGGHEHARALEFFEDYWSLFPEQDVCVSNHTMRPFRKAKAAGLPKAFMRDYGEFLNAPKNVRWSDHWQYNDCIFEHGENVSGALAAINAAKQNLMSTSIGHQHANGGVLYYQSKIKRIFGLNTGCLIDINAYAFDYAKAFRNKPTLGCGIIIGLEAYFVPMILNSAGRWTGKL